MKPRTKALDITISVKRNVARRDCCQDWPCCILCGKPAPTSNPLAFSNAHYISRAQGGLGIEKNVLTLCPICHKRYDGVDRAELKPILTQYLREQYDDWDERELIYKK